MLDSFFWSISPFVISAIIGIIIERLIFLGLGPDIEFSITYSWNKFWKGVKNPNIDINYFKVSNELPSKLQIESLRSTIQKKLSEYKISASIEAEDIKIQNFLYGGKKLEGYIRFGYSNFKKGYINNVVFEFYRNCKYNTLIEDITGLSNGVNKLEDIIKSDLSEGIIFEDSLQLNLNNLELLTGIIKKMNKDATKPVFDYLTLSHGMKIELSTNRVTISKEIESEGLSFLKDLVIMYL